ncbi:MAG: CPBP family intramembrane metalloprotease [Clostridiales bacterium]|nr:CPBP family intramembrane metalloprotease [Clostridiales bacterium]
MNTEKKIGVYDANVLYLIGLILFISLGAFVQERDFTSGMLITQVFIIMGTPLLYLALKKIDIKKTMRFNKLRLKHGLIIIIITILMYPLAVTANALGMLLLSLIGNLNIPQLPMPTDFMGYLKSMAVISLAAGICEEVFFRGFILTGYEKLNKRKAIIISAVLFGMFHLNLYNLFGPIVLGLIWGYLVVLTNSIYAGIIGHIVNNGFAVTLGFIFSGLQQQLQDNATTSAGASVELSTTQTFLVSVLVFAFISGITCTIAYFLVRIIKKDLEEPEIAYSSANPYKSEIVLNLDEENDKIVKVKYGLVKYWPVILGGMIFLAIAYIQIAEIIKLGLI